MSDTSTCEQCKTTSRRRLFKAAPDDWFYLEVTNDATGEELLVHFCSKSCYLVALQPGPGTIELKTKESIAEYQSKSKTLPAHFSTGCGSRLTGGQFPRFPLLPQYHNR